MFCTILIGALAAGCHKMSPPPPPPPCAAPDARLYFESGSAALTDEHRAQLYNVAALLRSCPEISALAIDGHTDSLEAPTPEAAFALSNARARAVVDELVVLQIDARRLIASGVGSTQPLVAMETEETRHQNRVVELSVLDTTSTEW